MNLTFKLQIDQLDRLYSWSTLFDASKDSWTKDYMGGVCMNLTFKLQFDQLDSWAKDYIHGQLSMGPPQIAGQKTISEKLVNSL